MKQINAFAFCSIRQQFYLVFQICFLSVYVTLFDVTTKQFFACLSIQHRNSKVQSTFLFTSYALARTWQSGTNRQYFQGHLKSKCSLNTFVNYIFHPSFDSSVGRAEDCSGINQTSLGRWFNSGSKEYFFYRFFTLIV